MHHPGESSHRRGCDEDAKDSSCRSATASSMSRAIPASLSSGVFLLCLCLLCFPLSCDAGPQFETWINKIVAEKGVDKYADFAEDINVAEYHFPKRGPAAKIIYAPKTHKSRYRNYKQRPEHPMIHTLKTPSRPTSMFASATLPKNQVHEGGITLHWTPPKSHGGTEITDYELSRDGGVTWTSIGLNNRTTIEDLLPNESYNFCLRAVNKIGGGAWMTLAFDNFVPDRIGMRHGILNKDDMRLKVLISREKQAANGVSAKECAAPAVAAPTQVAAAVS